MTARITEETGIDQVGSCRLVDLEQHEDERGSLSVVDSGRTVGFGIKRIYYLHDLRTDTSRGGHAHRSLEQLIIAVHGSFTITLDDGFNRASHVLDRPGIGMYIGPMVWRNLSDFTEGVVCLVLASCHYDESDYYRDYGAFLRDCRRKA